uniref:N-acetyltransferase domain-containing protein n=1 Tax=Macrostomum lignano TaxID=282301 RepID=A0A1I8HXQ8_9PLAT
MESQSVPSERVIDGLRYRVARPDDRDATWKLMLQDFFPKTPLNKHIGGVNPEDLNIDLTLPPGLLGQGVTVVTEDPSSGALVGARVSSLVPRQSAKRHPLVLDQQLAARYPKNAIVTRVLDHLTTPVDLYSHYNVDTVVDFKYLVVLEAMRSRSIAKRLIDFSLELAKLRGVPVVNVVAAHRHTGRIFEGLGFDRLNSVLLVEYNDPVDGERPFAGLDPEELREIVLYAKRIE